MWRLLRTWRTLASDSRQGQACVRHIYMCVYICIILLLLTVAVYMIDMCVYIYVLHYYCYTVAVYMIDICVYIY